MSAANYSAPHTSCRYAVVFAEAFEPEAEGYQIAAVHSLSDEGYALVSVVSWPFSGAMGFGQPTWVKWASILFMAPNSKDAIALRRGLEDEDRRMENDRKVDAQRDDYNRDEAIR